MGSLWPQLGPNLAQLGPKLDPLGALWPPQVDPKAAQSPPKSPQMARKLARRSPRPPRTPPRTPFGSILVPFGRSPGVFLGVVWGGTWRQALCRKLGRPTCRELLQHALSLNLFLRAPRGRGFATWIRAVPLRHASACEGPCTYLNFCTSLPALTFLHFPFCTYSCTSLPALPFLGGSCRDFPHEGGSFPGVGSRKELSFLLK